MVDLDVTVAAEIPHYRAMHDIFKEN